MIKGLKIKVPEPAANNRLSFIERFLIESIVTVK